MPCRTADRLHPLAPILSRPASHPHSYAPGKKAYHQPSSSAQRQRTMQRPERQGQPVGIGYDSPTQPSQCHPTGTREPRELPSTSPPLGSDVIAITRPIQRAHRPLSWHCSHSRRYARRGVDGIVAFISYRTKLGHF